MEIPDRTANRYNAQPMSKAMAAISSRPIVSHPQGVTLSHSTWESRPITHVLRLLTTSHCRAQHMKAAQSFILRVRKLIRQCRSKFPRLIKRCSPEASLEQRLTKRCSSGASLEQRLIKRVTFQGVDELISKEIILVAWSLELASARMRHQPPSIYVMHGRA